jgi:cysteine dioxygenase
MFSLKNIISELENTNEKLDKLQYLLDKYDDKEWKEHISFSDKTYKKNLIFRNKNYEIYLICWKSKQFSYIHNHPERGCILKVLKGDLTEHKYDTNNLEIIESLHHTIGSLSYIDDNLAYHSVGNESKEVAISLHIYSPPKFVANIF